MESRTPGRSVAVVGAGPAGLFAAQALLASDRPQIHVDVFDRLPTPGGLVRAGVAPDHPRIKSVAGTFDVIAAHPRFRFFGNVELGRHFSRPDLLRRYDVVLYAVGLHTDRPLGIPGEQLPGVHSAVSLVGWYNGHPDHRDLSVNLDTERAVVVGNGNVALDLARILITPVERLRRTDIADHALEVLARSKIREVVVLGRRGPAQATFTAPEVAELGSLSGAQVLVDPSGPGPDPATLSLSARRTHAVLSRLSEINRQAEHDLEPARRIRLRFLRSPVKLLGRDRLERVIVARNRLDGARAEAARALDTGDRQGIRAGLLVRATGYRGTRLEGLPFEESSGTVSHIQGRVLGSTREYVAGWIKRGPSGTIGVNRKCAADTVRQLIADLAALPEASMSSGPIDDGWLRAHHDVVSWSDWAKIDGLEIARGARQGRPRVKLCHLRELLDAARERSVLPSADVGP